MNVQTSRTWLAAKLAELTPPGMWTTTLSAFPELKATHTIQIGHAAPSPDTFRRRRVELPVIWWVNEGNELAAVGDMYDALSFAPGSVAARLLDLDEVRSVTVDDVGPEPFGPTGFVRAVTAVTVVFDDTPDDEEEDGS